MNNKELSYMQKEIETIASWAGYEVPKGDYDFRRDASGASYSLITFCRKLSHQPPYIIERFIYGVLNEIISK